MNIAEELKHLIRGEVQNDEETLEKYSKDTSLFEVRPEVVVCPKDVEDVKNLVSFVREQKESNPNLSITGRSAGSDMTGGPLNESIILSFTEHFNRFEIDKENMETTVEPGVYYRDFEEESTPLGLSMPVFPASKRLAAFGGMIMNNCGGEKTLRYGQMREFVNEMSVVLSDGNEYTFRKLSRSEFEEKKAQTNFEGEIYKRTSDLIEKNWDTIERSKPQTTKNSSGYALWRVWNKKDDTFDLTHLFTGSQGTLGILTQAKVRLVHEKSHQRMVALFLSSWDDMPNIVNAILPLEPMSLETFDDDTLMLGLRFMPQIAKRAGMSFWKFALKFLPEVGIGIKMLGVPQLIILVALEEENAEELDQKTAAILNSLKKFPVYSRVLADSEEMEKYWVMRRESFNLLRQHVKGKRTAPFIEDFCIVPEKVPQFLPKALEILRKNGIRANIAGHAGDGNFHIIPLMDLTQKREREKIPRVATEFYNLVAEYGGSISAEHNDGIVRTPFIETMFGTDMYRLFEEVKNIFDPQNIFNPGKKVGGSIEYLSRHIATK